MRALLTNYDNSGVSLRLRILAYFIATITLTATLATYAYQVRGKQYEQILQVRENAQGLKEWHGKATIILERELRLWKDLLLQGTQKGPLSRTA
jgi:hypothetical protein